MDSSQFTQQLSRYSARSSSRSITNTNLKTLITQGTSQAGTFASTYLGKQVSVTSSNASLTNGTANWSTTLWAPRQPARHSPSATASSNVVFYHAGASLRPGATPSPGTCKRIPAAVALADGTYKLSAASTASDGSAVTTSVASAGTVTQIDMSSSFALNWWSETWKSNCRMSRQWQTEFINLAHRTRRLQFREADEVF